MLYLIGLGLWDEKDISLRGLEAVRKCDHVYLEAYTSILLVDKSKLVSTILLTTVRSSYYEVPCRLSAMQRHFCGW